MCRVKAWLELVQKLETIDVINLKLCKQRESSLCFTATLSKYPDLIGVMIIPMIFYVTWSGFFGFLINPIVEGLQRTAPSRM